MRVMPILKLSQIRNKNCYHLKYYARYFEFAQILKYTYFHLKCIIIEVRTITNGFFRIYFSKPDMTEV